ncbi:MAG: hypothetical protein IKX36_09205 [Prevotella sp.]|nr:hypothetical protein [Prevotella sp.]
MEQEEIFKIRSAKGCISAAWKWCCDQLGSLFRRTWLPITLLSVFAAVCRALCYLQSRQITGNIWLTIGIIISSICVFAACAWAISRLYQLLSSPAGKKNMLRSAWALFCACVLFVIIGFAVYGITLLTGHQWWIIVLSGTILLLLTLPIHYYHVRYISEEPTPPSSAIANYIKGFPNGLCRGYRYLGKLLTTNVLTLLMLLTITAIMAIPVVTISIAEIQSLSGATMGDPYDMPGSFIWLLAAITFVFIWLFYFLWQFLTVVNFYQYGSIEEHHREKQVSIKVDSDNSPS